MNKNWRKISFLPKVKNYHWTCLNSFSVIELWRQHKLKVLPIAKARTSGHLWLIHSSVNTCQDMIGVKQSPAQCWRGRVMPLVALRHQLRCHLLPGWPCLTWPHLSCSLSKHWPFHRRFWYTWILLFSTPELYLHPLRYYCEDPF